MKTKDENITAQQAVATVDLFGSLKTTGQWIKFVHALGRILSRDLNAKGVWELNNERSADGLAHGIGFFMRATEAQKNEAASLADKTCIEAERHFLPNIGGQRRAELARPKSQPQ